MAEHIINMTAPRLMNVQVGDAALDATTIPNMAWVQSVISAATAPFAAFVAQANARISTLEAK